MFNDSECLEQKCLSCLYQKQCSSAVIYITRRWAHLYVWCNLDAEQRVVANFPKQAETILPPTMRRCSRTWARPMKQRPPPKKRISDTSHDRRFKACPFSKFTRHSRLSPKFTRRFSFKPRVLPHTKKSHLRRHAFPDVRPHHHFVTTEIRGRAKFQQFFASEFQLNRCL